MVNIVTIFDDSFLPTKGKLSWEIYCLFVVFFLSKVKSAEKGYHYLQFTFSLSTHQTSRGGYCVGLT